MEQIGIILLVLLGGVTILALFLALTLLFPAAIAKIRRNLETGLGRSLLLGLVNFIFFAVLALVFSRIAEETGGFVAGVFIFMAAVILLVLTVLIVFGLVSFANILGERVGGETNPFQSILRGGTLLLLAGLAPYIGWFIFTPLVIWTGLGAAISALIRRQRQEVTE